MPGCRRTRSGDRGFHRWNVGLRRRATRGACTRFDLAPPRRFLFPAVLLLLADGPGLRLPAGQGAAGVPVRSRRSAERVPHAGPARARRAGRVRGPTTPRRRSRGVCTGSTPAGERALRIWMGVIKEERDRLDAVLRRYAASGGVDAALAGVEGGWGTVAGPSLSSVLPTGEPTHRARPRPMARAGSPADSVTRSGPYRARFAVVGRSLGRARRSPLDGRAAHVRRDGPARRGRDAGARWPGDAPTTRPRGRSPSAPTGCAPGTSSTTPSCAAGSTPAASRSVTLALRGGEASGAADRVRIAGDVTIHGVTRRLEGTVVVAEPGARDALGGRRAGGRHPRLRHRRRRRC